MSTGRGKGSVHFEAMERAHVELVVIGTTLFAKVQKTLYRLDIVDGDRVREVFFCVAREPAADAYRGANACKFKYISIPATPDILDLYHKARLTRAVVIATTHKTLVWALARPGLVVCGNATQIERSLHLLREGAPLYRPMTRAEIMRTCPKLLSTLKLPTISVDYVRMRYTMATDESSFRQWTATFGITEAFWSTNRTCLAVKPSRDVGPEPGFVLDGRERVIPAKTILCCAEGTCVSAQTSATLFVRSSNTFLLPALRWFALLPRSTENATVMFEFTKDGLVVVTCTDVVSNETPLIGAW